MNRKLLMLATLLACALPLAAGAKGNAEKGKAASEKTCAACHGVDGNKPVSPENPVLAGQHRDYLIKALSDYKSGKRSNPIMKGFAAQLSKQDIEDLATWFASQPSNLKVKH